MNSLQFHEESLVYRIHRLFNTIKTLKQQNKKYKKAIEEIRGIREKLRGLHADYVVDETHEICDKILKE